MIARSWHDLQTTPGNRGVLIFRRTEGDVTHFEVTTLWESVAAIRRFAGDCQRARYYPEDDDYLLEREPLATHHEVVFAEVPLLSGSK
jgi:heme-degrading monooxygenase HmoA